MSAPLSATDGLDICADIVERARAAGADEAEAYFEAATNRVVDARGGSIESLTTAGTRGVGVRVLVNGALGFASGSDLDPAGRADLAEQAVWLARASAPDPSRVLPDPAPISAADLGIFDPAVPELSVQEIVSLLTRTEQAAFAADTRIDAPHIERFGQTVERIAVANSRGIALTTAATSCYISLSIIARQDGLAERGYAGVVARGPGGLVPEEIGRRAALRAVTPMGGAPLTTRRATVVFEPDIIADLLRGVSQALFGDAVVKGRSLFAARNGDEPWIGRRIGAATVTFVDDGTVSGAPATLPFDGEGVPSQRTPLIEQGVLRGFLHNVESGRQAGAGSTGNGTRSQFKFLPEVGGTNLILSPGTRSPEELIAGVDEGLYVVSSRNVGGINPVSGDYSVGASGRRISNGELAEPVSGVTLAAPMLQVLENLRECGSDLRWISGAGGYVGAPTVVVDDVTIGGR
ncbi:MAG: TldD/PmbA family protein [Chloroflexi bacterium]|nr:TldD/PmbA family protein [Chloroflexota bacterium]